MLTEAQLRELLGVYLHEDDTISNPSGLRQLLNLAQRRIVRECPWGLGAKEGTFATVASTQEYSLASDFYQMRKVWDTTSGRSLHPVDRNLWIAAVEARTTIPTGTPRWYTIYGYSESSDAWRIRLHETPAGIYTIKYWYYWMPADISESNVGPIVEIGFDELLLWCAVMIQREINDPAGALDVMRKHYMPLLEIYQAYRPMKPDYTPTLMPQDSPSGGDILKLPPEFPAN